MKKTLMSLLAALVCAANAVAANEETSALVTLQSKLQNIPGFSADFQQRVVDLSGNALQESTGKLVVVKPNLVKWHTVQPEETLVVSDGQSLWFYEPFVEEVNAYSLADAIANTPILLLSSDDKALWQNYDVTALSSQQFQISSKDEASRIKHLVVYFNEANQLRQFDIVDMTGQVSAFTLENYKTDELPEPAFFQFTVPEGVLLSDQR